MVIDKDEYVLIIGLIITAPCNSNQSQTKQADTTIAKSTGIEYTCPMHLKYISNKAGTCPKCGIGLVEKDESK